MEGEYLKLNCNPSHKAESSPAEVEHLVIFNACVLAIRPSTSSAATFESTDLCKRMEIFRVDSPLTESCEGSLWGTRHLIIISWN